MSSKNVVSIAERAEQERAKLDSEPAALLLDNKGKPIPCEFNIHLLLARSPAGTRLHYDTFWRQIRSDQSADAGSKSWTDDDDRETLLWIQRTAIPRATMGMVRTAVEALATEHCRDALAHFVKTLPPWDGTRRIALALHEAFGAPEGPLVEAASSNLLRAMIARALRPGEKVDHLFVFEGHQGILKSTGIKALGGPYHAEVTEPLGSPNCVREIRCAWLAELSELRPLVGRDSETAKAFITRLEDPIVEKWEKRVTTYPRRCVFVGTTNEMHYWDDPTGARRLIPIPCGTTGPIRPDLIEANRCQWFAEAAADIAAGAIWWDFPNDIEREREERQKVDPWQELVERELVGEQEVTIAELLEKLGVDTDRREAKHEARVAAALRRAGWTRGHQRREAGVRIRPWRGPKEIEA